MPKKEQLKTLSQIMLDTGTDKNADGHDYASTYQVLFDPLRKMPINVVELGVYQGASLKAWSRYFTNAHSMIIGVDIDTAQYVAPPEEERDERVHVWAYDVTSPQLADRLQLIGPLSVVIDDASHQVAQQSETFKLLWPLVSPGGFYVIEDLHTWWWERANPASAPAFAHELVDTVIGKGRQRFEDYGTDVHAVHVYGSLMVLQKKF